MTTTTADASTGTPSKQWDVVRLSVLTNRMEGVARKMQNTLFRTSRSTVLNTARDFSCCIVTGDDQLLVAAESLPIHVMSGPDLQAKWLKELHPTLNRGDAFLDNSPYHGNSHAGDHCIIVPVIDDEGEHRFTVIAKAHMADIGNSLPTTLWPTATDVYHEGALIFPSVKVQEDYRDIEDVIRMCRTRIRIPEVWYGDYLAVLGAARVGERELLELGREVGWEELEQYTEEWFDYSEARMRAAIAQLPHGRTTTHHFHDPLPVEECLEGVPLEATVEVDTEGELVEVDFRENPDCPPCGINMTEATARTMAMIGVFNSLPEVVPPNGGSFRRVRVHLRENCVAGIPRHPVSCSAATFALADRLGNLVQRAIADLGEGAGMAEAGSLFAAGTCDVSGNDPRRGNEPFRDLVLLGLTGGAGHPRGDGWLVNGEATDNGCMMRTSTEVVELMIPIRIWVDSLVPDTGGAGRFRGAPAAYVEYSPVDTEMTCMWACDGYVHPALGARDGHPGARARNYRRQGDGTIEPLSPWGHIELQPEESVIGSSTAGGGYGSPLEREVERVQRDVASGLVSLEGARDVYGVLIDEGTGGVDVAATEARRAELAGNGGPSPRLAAVGELDDGIWHLVSRYAAFVGTPAPERTKVKPLPEEGTSIESSV